jgi:hypothetical protein
MEDGILKKNVHLSTCGASYLEMNSFLPCITECHKHNQFEQQNFLFQGHKKGLPRSFHIIQELCMLLDCG